VSDDRLRELTDTLRGVAGDAARIEARWLIEGAATPDKLDRFVARRLAGEPVDRILGRRGFWTLDLAVTPDTLSPRPDTEVLVEAVLKHPRIAHRKADPLRILDLGTGTGAILLALLSELQQATGLGVDISAAALAVAEANARRARLAERVKWAHSDWTDGVTGAFDIIVSNPPYIPSADIASLDREVRDHDPHLALDGGPDGLAPYRQIIPALPRLFAPGGIAALEFGIGQSDALCRMALAHGFRDPVIAEDLSKIDRVILLQSER
jgi:release factor glutamine methyltransferase